MALALSRKKFCVIIYLMLGHYKILGSLDSVKNVLFRFLTILFLVALAYWMLTGLIFTVKLLINPPVF